MLSILIYSAIRTILIVVRLKLCALLDKAERREVKVPLDYVGFAIPSEFVVGYGLDHAGRYRNLPYIAALEEEPAP